MQFMVRQLRWLNMRFRAFQFVLVVVALSTSYVQAAAAETCTARGNREARAIAGEIAGPQAFRQPLSNGWTFALVPDRFGWNIRVFDRDGLDLTQMTPPYRGVPNPREIHGWHFRNADNSGPNDGSVNAPQTLRLFYISPGLSGTGGFKPSADTVDPASMDSDGRGALTIVDFRLADLEPGAQARMVYLKFEACLNWPRETAVTATAADDVIAPDLIAQMRACGLDASLIPSRHLRPTTLQGDFDGDGRRDVVLPIARKSDGKRALAICRGGKHLNVVGLGGRMGHLDPIYFDRMDWWSLMPKGEVGQGVAEGPPPVLLGDAITIGQEGKSSVLIYWTGTRFWAYWQGD